MVIVYLLIYLFICLFVCLFVWLIDWLILYFLTFILIEKFIYDLYDPNKTEELTYNEIIMITKELYGREFKKNQNLQK